MKQEDGDRLSADAFPPVLTDIFGSSQGRGNVRSKKERTLGGRRKRGDLV